MNDLLKNDIEELFKKHPELKNRKLVFSDTAFAYAKDADMLFAPQEGQLPLCKQKGEMPAVIKGHSAKVEVRRSPVHGYGVFAKEDIAEGELIEECKLLKMGWRGGYPTDPTLKDYVWGRKQCACVECKNHGVYQYLAMGLGSIYNHNDAPNTRQQLDFKTEVMTIWARRDIKKDEELFVTYGDKYFLIRDFWKNINENKKLERVMAEKRKEKHNNSNG